ncbi:vitamin B12 dependent-methionine synthase activation domain-containing protein [Clostridium sp. DL1XJH146]
MIIDRSEVLRYLGYRNQETDTTIENLIDLCIEEVKEYSIPKSTFKTFDLMKIQDTQNVKITDTNLTFHGRDIYNHLKNSTKCTIMASTLGVQIEKKTRLYEKSNLTKALIFDACATTAIESFCDEIEEEVKKEAEKLNLAITYRYSPGYGDFDLNIQHNILNVLDAHKKIGLTVTDTNILLPRKSVTAVIGFQDKNIGRQHPGCNTCNKKNDCLFRKAGDYCGN